MSIKSDKWIHRMAAEHGMIEPFEPGQVKENEKGRIVSCGVSSYGYDVQCSPHLKIFTNINIAMVDPKAFDSKSSQDFRRRYLHCSAQLIRAGVHGRVFPHPAQRAHDLPG